MENYDSHLTFRDWGSEVMIRSKNSHGALGLSITSGGEINPQLPWTTNSSQFLGTQYYTISASYKLGIIIYNFKPIELRISAGYAYFRKITSMSYHWEKRNVFHWEPSSGDYGWMRFVQKFETCGAGRSYIKGSLLTRTGYTYTNKYVREIKKIASPGVTLYIYKHFLGPVVGVKLMVNQYLFKHLYNLEQQTPLYYRDIRYNQWWWTQYINNFGYVKETFHATLPPTFMHNDILKSRFVDINRLTSSNDIKLMADMYDEDYEPGFMGGYEPGYVENECYGLCDAFKDIPDSDWSASEYFWGGVIPYRIMSYFKRNKWEHDDQCMLWFRTPTIFNSFIGY